MHGAMSRTGALNRSGRARALFRLRPVPCIRGQAAKALNRNPLPQVDRMRDRQTRLKTLPSPLCWRSVKNVCDFPSYLDPMISHLRDRCSHRLVIGLHDLNLCPHARLIVRSYQTVLFPQFFNRHTGLGLYYCVDTTNCK